MRAIREEMLGAFDRLDEAHRDKRYLRAAKDRRPEPESYMERQVLGIYKEHGLNPQLQYPIGPYYADFAFVEKRVVVEYDGRLAHQGREDYDRKRDQYMHSQMWRVYRVSCSNGFFQTLLDGKFHCMCRSLDDALPLVEAKHFLEGEVVDDWLQEHLEANGYDGVLYG